MSTTEDRSGTGEALSVGRADIKLEVVIPVADVDRARDTAIGRLGQRSPAVEESA